MTGTDSHGRVRCQMGECRNPAALTVTIELPTSWTESREYTARTLEVAVCGDCAGVLEADAKALLEARARFARRLETAADYADLMRLLLALIDAVGAPYEPGRHLRHLAGQARQAQGPVRLAPARLRQAPDARRQDGQGRLVAQGPAVAGHVGSFRSP